METWWGLEDAMDLLSTSRRLTFRASRVSSVVSHWPLDLDASSSRTSTTSRSMQSRFRQPLWTSNLQPQRRTAEKGTDFKGSEGDSRSAQVAAENDQLKSKLRSVQEENVKLQAVVTDLTQVNKRWQKYNNDRQIYVQKLLNTIQDQQEQLNKMGEQRAFSSAEVGAKPSSESNLEPDISKLQETERKLKEKIQILEFQVKVNRDDWEAEHNEKKQAIKDREDIEQRVTSLMDELQELKQSIIEKRLPKDFVSICESCRARFSSSTQPVGEISAHSKMYRTAVHLPCYSQQWCETSSCNSHNSSLTELAIDGEGNSSGYPNRTRVDESEAIVRNTDRKCTNSHSTSSLCSLKSYTESNNVTDIWNIERSRDTSTSKEDVSVSYSRAPTVPLISSPICNRMALSDISSTSSVALASGCLNDENPLKYERITNGGSTVTSFVRIPVVKSSSAPDSKPDNESTKSFRSSLDSFNTSSPTAPVAFINTPDSLERRRKKYENADADIGVETLTKEEIICPGCGSIFPPETHLKFLDHFESCQRINL